jgi:hypothetical protein
MFDGYGEFIIVEFLSNYKGIVVNPGSDFHVNGMQPGHLYVIVEFVNGFEGLWLRKVFPTESSTEEWVDDETVVASILSMAV